MSVRYTKSADRLVQFGSSCEVSSRSISHRLEKLHRKLIKIQTEFTGQIPPNIQLSLDQIQNYLNFAHENHKKGFLNVSNSCLQLAENYLDRYQSFDNF